jgi:hypothetical protein
MAEIGNAGRTDFTERLNRIQRQGPNTMGEIHVGPVSDEVLQSRMRSKGTVSPIPSWRENIGYPAQIVGVFLAGMAAVFVARYVRFHMMGGSLAGADADLTMLMDFGFAAMVTFFLRAIMRTEGSEFTMAKTAGIAAMICTMHNAVHAQPKLFGVIFSPEWVEEVVYMTEPKSILFRGNSFVMGEPRAETPPYPSHWAEEDRYLWEEDFAD